MLIEEELSRRKPISHLAKEEHIEREIQGKLINNVTR